MKLLKEFIICLLDLFSRIFLGMLIWAGAIIAWTNNGNTFIGIILFISGIVWFYKNMPKNETIKTKHKRGKKKTIANGTKNERK